MATLWTIIAGAFAFLIGDLFLTKSSKDKLQNTLDASKYKTGDDALAAQQAADAAKIISEQKALGATSEPTGVPELSPDQVTNFWNTKK